MKSLLVVLGLATTTSCTVIGAAAGAGIGNLAGNTGKGALIGAILGVRADISLAKDLRKLKRTLIFW
jgi:hypothetical protein